MASKQTSDKGIAYFLLSYQVILLLALPFYFFFSPPTWGMVAVMVIVLYLSGMSITGGYHRYFAHPTFKTSPWVENVLLFFASTAMQGSALRWSYDHRRHHAFVDSNDDPYSIHKGFWYAHCLWLLEPPKEVEPRVVSDLMKNPRVMFQHRHAIKCMIFSNVAMFACVGWLLNDYLGAFMMIFWLRLFLLHHFTWFINSLAHTWGNKPFCQEQSAVNNFIISLLTFGEGYHNYHHCFANDYRNGIRWYHFDPTKWMIWIMEKLGIATGLRRVDPYVIQKKMVTERKQLLSKKVRRLWYVKKDELEQKIHEITDRIVTKMNQCNKLKAKYQALKDAKEEKELLLNLRQELKALQRAIKDDWHALSNLSRHIMHMKPMPV